MSNQGNQSHFKEREAYWPFVREIHVNVGLPMIVNVARNFPPKLKQPAWFLSLSIDPQLRPRSEIAGGYVQQGGFFLFSFETFQVQTGMAKSFLCSLEENLSPYSVSWSVHLSASSAVPLRTPSLGILQRSLVGQSPYRASENRQKKAWFPWIL